MDKLKELFKGKQGKIMIGAIIVVVIVALVARSKGKTSAGVNLAEYPSYQTSSVSGDSQTDVSNAVNDLARDMNNQLKSQAESQTKLAEQFNNSLAMTQNAFSSMFMGLQGELADVNALNKDLNAKLAAQATQKLSSSSTSAIMWDTSDTNNYSIANPYQGISVVTPVYGKGGADYNTLDAAGKKAMQDDINRVKTDSSYRASEVERANQVIANRKAAGLSTAEQEKYLSTLQKLG